MNEKPLIVYLQTVTECNGHCRYCPFDDVYLGGELEPATMSEQMYLGIIEQLAAWDYQGRLGFLLHYEPTLDERLPYFIKLIREKLPLVSVEIATNGFDPDSPILKCVDKVKVVRAGSLVNVTARAGNARACPENAGRKTFKSLPKCNQPERTMCIAANGDVILCCQDWRHEVVVGSHHDIIGARMNIMKLIPYAEELKLQICRDCSEGLVREEIEDRVGRRSVPAWLIPNG